MITVLLPPAKRAASANDSVTAPGACPGGCDQNWGIFKRRFWGVYVRHSQRLAEVLDDDNTASDVWADTAYRSAKNEDMLAERGFASRIHRKKPKGKPMPDRTRIANAQKSKVRSKVEHVFAHQKGLMHVFIRTIGLARARVKIGLATSPTTCAASFGWNASAPQPEGGSPQTPPPRQPRSGPDHDFTGFLNEPKRRPPPPLGRSLRKRGYWRCPAAGYDAT